MKKMVRTAEFHYQFKCELNFELFSYYFLMKKKLKLKFLYQKHVFFLSVGGT